MSWNWHARESKVEPRHEIGGDDPAKVYHIGQYQVTVRASGDVLYRRRDESTNPRDTLPNMVIADGEIRILVSDLVGEALARMEPAELAQGLWSEKAVRDEFRECLANQYRGEGIDDFDRRAFLHDVQSAVHSRALDELVGKIASLEYQMSKRSFFYHEVNGINQMLHDRELHFRTRFNDETINLPRLRHEDNDPDFKIGGKHWNDARDWWRKEALKLFPSVPHPSPDGAVAHSLKSPDGEGESR